MKKKNIFRLEAIRRIAGLIAFVAIIGFSMIACDDKTKDIFDILNLNGTWADEKGNGYRFDNGIFEAFTTEYNSIYKGTYTVESGNITITFTHLHGGIFSTMEIEGLDIDLESKWYTKDELEPLETSLLGYEEELDRQIAELNDEIDALNDEIDALDEEDASYDEDLSELNAKLFGLNMELLGLGFQKLLPYIIRAMTIDLLSSPPITSPFDLKGDTLNIYGTDVNPDTGETKYTTTVYTRVK